VIYVTRVCGIVERWKNGDSDLGMMEFWKNEMVEFSFSIRVFRALFKIGTQIFMIIMIF